MNKTTQEALTSARNKKMNELDGQKMIRDQQARMLSATKLYIEKLDYEIAELGATLGIR